MGEVLAIIVETIRQIAILVQPVMPESATKLLDQLKVPHDERSFDVVAGAARITAGITIEKPQGVFPRYQEPEGEGA
jgi:methionyl-tRNA synthetase